LKKILAIFTVLSLIASSCSSEENSNSEEKLILPKTISYVYPNIYLGTNTKSTLSYDGNKIVSSVDENSKTIFTYTGDVITKQEVFDVDLQGKETKTDEAIYTYENGKLKTRIFKEGISSQYADGEYIQKAVYTHSSNGTISYINYQVDKITKVETKDSEGVLTYENGNLVKHKIGNTTYVYEYDAKNNPLKNVLGFNLLLNEISAIGRNNVVKTTFNSSQNSNTGIYLTTYIYSDKDYPTKQTSYSSGTSIEYEIEYTY